MAIFGTSPSTGKTLYGVWKGNALYCQCDNLAQRYQVTDSSKDTFGKYFLRCWECPTFVWEDDMFLLQPDYDLENQPDAPSTKRRDKWQPRIDDHFRADANRSDAPPPSSNAGQMPPSSPTPGSRVSYQAFASSQSDEDIEKVSARTNTMSIVDSPPPTPGSKRKRDHPNRSLRSDSESNDDPEMLSQPETWVDLTGSPGKRRQQELTPPPTSHKKGKGVANIWGTKSPGHREVIDLEDSPDVSYSKRGNSSSSSSRITLPDTKAEVMHLLDEKLDRDTLEELNAILERNEQATEDLVLELTVSNRDVKQLRRQVRDQAKTLEKIRRDVM